MRNMRALLAAVSCILVVSACASATKRYEQGQELELQGRTAEAAQRYIDALKKDATLAEARQRLAETGARAVADGMRETDAFEMTAAHIDAAESLRSLDALVRDAAGVGVSLAVPSGYAEKRRVVLGYAVDQAINEATTARVGLSADQPGTIGKPARQLLRGCTACGSRTPAMGAADRSAGRTHGNTVRHAPRMGTQ